MGGNSSNEMKNNFEIFVSNQYVQTVRREVKHGGSVIVGLTFQTAVFEILSNDRRIVIHHSVPSGKHLVLCYVH